MFLCPTLLKQLSVLQLLPGSAWVHGHRAQPATAPLCCTGTQTTKPHPFELLAAQKSFLLPGEKPEQHCNSCLKHFFPAYSVIPLKAHAFLFPTNPRWEHLAFSSFIFSSLFLPKVSRLAFLSVSVADPHGRGALPPGEPGRVTPAPPSPRVSAPDRGSCRPS